MTKVYIPPSPATTSESVSIEEPLPIDLPTRAWQAMWDEGFAPELPPGAAAQAAALDAAPQPSQHSGDQDEEVQDLRTLLWSSIDNPDSRDLDQVEWAERLPDGSIRFLVGIADVDCRVPQWTPLDAYASRSTTSVYTGIVTFPMLPEELSTDLTSLNPGADRLGVVVDVTVNDDGTITHSDIYRAWLRNRAKLVYEIIGPWLEGKTATPDSVTLLPKLEEQVLLQNEAASRLQARRQREGALELQTIEAQPSLTPDGLVTLRLPQRNQAHLLIENLMVAANGVVARFLSEQGVPAIQRIVRRPERWARIVELAESLGDNLPEEADTPALAAFLARRREADPLRFPDLSLAVVKLLGPGEYTVVRPGEDKGGHFALAAQTYTHSTAPNRRYADLIAQRLLKATLSGRTPPYKVTDLEVLAQHCTEREDAARKVERLMRKVAAALLMSERVGETFEAVVTGVSRRKGTFIRVLTPPVEGRVVAGEAGLDVGDSVVVRLLSVEPVQGWIDFARVFA